MLAIAKPKEQHAVEMLITRAKLRIEQAQGFINSEANPEYWMGIKDAWEEVLRGLRAQGISVDNQD